MLLVSTYFEHRYIDSSKHFLLPNNFNISKLQSNFFHISSTWELRFSNLNAQYITHRQCFIKTRTKCTSDVLHFWLNTIFLFCWTTSQLCLMAITPNCRNSFLILIIWGCTQNSSEFILYIIYIIFPNSITTYITYLEYRL